MSSPHVSIRIEDDPIPIGDRLYIVSVSVFGSPYFQIGNVTSGLEQAPGSMRFHPEKNLNRWLIPRFLSDSRIGLENTIVHYIRNGMTANGAQFPFVIAGER